MKAKQEIRVTCTTKDSLPLEKIIPFQGDLKTLSKTDFEKLKAAIIKYGLSFPSFIWQRNGSAKCLDGHQRSHVLSEMKKEGWKIPPVPVVYVDAKNEKEAKEKILLLSSQYGRYTQESLYECMDTFNLTLDDIGTIELPQIDLGSFAASYYREPVPPDGFKSYGEDLEVDHICPRCGFQFSGGKTVPKNVDNMADQMTARQQQESAKPGQTRPFGGAKSRPPAGATPGPGGPSTGWAGRSPSSGSAGFPPK